MPSRLFLNHDLSLYELEPLVNKKGSPFRGSLLGDSPNYIIRCVGLGSVALLLALELVTIVNQGIEHGVNRVRLVAVELHGLADRPILVLLAPLGIPTPTNRKRNVQIDRSDFRLFLLGPLGQIRQGIFLAAKASCRFRSPTEGQFLDRLAGSTSTDVRLFASAGENAQLLVDFLHQSRIDIVFLDFGGLDFRSPVTSLCILGHVVLSFHMFGELFLPPFHETNMTYSNDPVKRHVKFFITK